MSRNKIIPYKKELRSIARTLRKNMTLSEILLWQQIKGRALGVQFHRQVPMDQFVVDFYCHEIMLAIEVDGSSHDNPQKFELDKQRQKRLEAFGVKFLRFTDNEVKDNLNGVIKILSRKVKELESECG
jgi:very-short-patch-repair endonuclease